MLHEISKIETVKIKIENLDITYYIWFVQSKSLALAEVVSVNIKQKIFKIIVTLTYNSPHLLKIQASIIPAAHQ